MLADKKLFLLDIDGTVCLGDRLIDGAAEFLSAIRKSRGQFVFITNNSTKDVEDYIEKFRKLGIRTDAENFVTAASAAESCLKRGYQGKKIYVMGTRSLVSGLKRAGIRVAEDPKDPEIACVLVAYDNELTYQKLETVCRILSTRQVDFLATNPDLVCPVEFGYVPDCGSICQMITIACGQMPRYIGKPEPEMIEISIGQNSFSKEETLIVGDRLYTDIACGIQTRTETALVLTGEAKKDDILTGSIHPEYVFPSVRELHDAWISSIREEQGGNPV